MTPHAKLNRATKAGATKAANHLPSLTRAYGRALRAAGRRAATQLTHTETVTAAAVPKPPDWQPPPINQILNQAELVADTERKTAKLHRTILTAAASTALEPFGIAFDIKAATSQAALDAVAKRIQTGIGQAITTEITNAILNGYAEGHSVARVATAIRAATDQISRPRADMLARTDLVALANSGSYIAASQIDGVTAKSWLTADDDKVREMHVEADGQTVPLDEPFDVCGQSPMYPGDPILDDSCAANCRCSITYSDDLTEGISDNDNTGGITADAGDETGSVPAYAHYRPADDPAEACGTCAYYTAATSRCTMFEGDPAVLADYTCDEWVAETAEVGITSGGAMSVIDVETLTVEQRAELRDALDKPLSPLAAKMAAVRTALAANGAGDTFGDDELRAVIVTLDALRTTAPTLTLENAVLLAATEGGTPWQATLCVAGQPTVDSGMKRLLDREGGSWLPLPLPLAIMDDSPHADMVTSSPMCGRIDQIWMAGDVCQGSGVFFDSSDDPEVAAAGSRAAAIVQEMRRMGISVDLVDTEVELVRWQGSGEMLDPVNDPTQDEIGGPDASYGDFPDGEIVEVIYDEAEEPEYVYLFRRWVIAGATICPVQALTQATISLVASAFDGRGEWRTVTDFTVPAEPALTAGAAGMVPLEPPAAWFDDPALDGPTPLTITDEGRVFGHLAAWDTCHTGRPGCTPPPRSPSGYMNFHLGELVTAEGTRVAVGTLTFDAPHASLPLSASQAVRHYDDTATAGAHVRAGEDAYGIWLAGALNPRLSAEEARTLMAAPPSGDWRQVQSGQGRDLVGAHAVNQPGFIVQRRGLSLAASAEDCGVCDEALARELDVLAASADGLEALAALVAS